MSVRFDGAADTARRTGGGGYVNATGAYTITFWVYPIASTDFRTLCMVGGGGTNYHVAAIAEGKWAVASSSGGLTEGSAVAATSVWYKCVMRYNGTNQLTLTVDGTQVAAVAAGDLSSAELIEFGNDLNQPGDEWLNGRITNAKVFHANLNATQANAELATRDQVLTPVASYPLQVHTDLNDYSGNGRHLTAGGTLTTEADPPGLVAYVLTVEAGVISAVGQSVDLRVDRRLSVDHATLSLAGQSANLRVARRVDVQPAEIAAVGQSADLLTARRLVVEPSIYALVGQEVDLIYGTLTHYTIEVEPGIYNLVGQDVGVRVARKLLAEPAIYSATGQDIGLLAARKLSVDPGIYNLVGQDVGLRVARRLVVDPAIYSLVGQEANLIYTPLGAYILSVEPAIYSATGQDVGLTVARRLAVDPAIYTIVGQTVPLLVGRVIAVEAQSYALVGQEVGLVRGYRLPVEAGVISVVGQSVILIWSGADVPETPLSRVYLVAGEIRVLSIAADDRVLGVAAEDRVFAISH